MGGPYVVGPSEDTTWTLDQDRFVDELSRRWPAADIFVGPQGSPSSVTWSIRNFDSDGLEVAPWLDGSLDAARQVSTLYGDPGLAAEFITWLPSYASEPLVLVADNDLMPLRLRPTLTREDVLAYLS